MSNVNTGSNINTGKGDRTDMTLSAQVKNRLDGTGRINQLYSELIEQLVDCYVQQGRRGG